MIRDDAEFRRELEKINEWWLTNAVKEATLYPIKREKFEILEKELETPRINIIVGPRRVGKSIVVKQLIGNLLQDAVNPRNILYYSLDDPSLAIYSDEVLKDLLDYFLENIAVEGRKYVFFDEIHLFREWYKWLKSFFDKKKDIKFVVTGSSSLHLQREANFYLRGRTSEIELFPLDFYEFLKFSGMNVSKISFADLFKLEEFEIRKIQHMLKNYFNEYLTVGGFPEWFEVKNQPNPKLRWFTMLIEDIPKKAIFEDIATIFEIRNAKVLEQILAFIVAHQSQVLSYEAINDVAKLDRSTLINYIEFLKSSLLIAEIPKFAGIKEQMKAKKKYLVIDQGLRNAILKDYEVREENVGFVLENVVGTHLFLHLKRAEKKLFYWKSNDEIDFIVTNKEVIPAEVKYKNKINESDKRSLNNFLKKFKKDKAIMITKALYGQEKTEEATLHFIPAEVFLLCSD